MFGDNAAIDDRPAFGAQSVPTFDSIRFGAALSSEGAVIPLRRTRLAELVHHLGGVPVGEARRAIRRSGQTCPQDDPLDIVAAALIQLRQDSPRCLSV